MTRISGKTKWALILFFFFPGTKVLGKLHRRDCEEKEKKECYVSLISNVPSGQYRKHGVKTQTFPSYVSNYQGMFSHLQVLQDIKGITNILCYLAPSNGIFHLWKWPMPGESEEDKIASEWIMDIAQCSSMQIYLSQLWACVGLPEPKSVETCQCNSWKEWQLTGHM